jgi:hypothetical protein
MDERGWRERTERYERALLAVVVAGSVTAGVLFGEEGELHIHAEPGSIQHTIDLSSPVVTGRGL